MGSGRPADFGSQHGQVRGGIAPGQGRLDRLSVRQSDHDVFVPFNHVVRGDKNTLARPDDAAGGNPVSGFHPNHAGSAGSHRLGQGIGQTRQYLGHM